MNFFLPFTTLVLYSSLISISPQLEAAARDLGASKWVTLRRVMLPLSGNAIFGAALFVFFCRPATTSRRCSWAGSARARRSAR